MLIKGSPMAIKYRGVVDIILFSQFLAITSENNKTKDPLPNPNNKENKRQLFTAFKPFKKLFCANCSETRHVQARLKPEVDNVIANR